MLTKYILLFIAAALQSSAEYNRDYYVVNNGFASNNHFHPMLGSRRTPKPFNIQDILKLNSFQDDRVRIQLYYECLCPGCRNFDNGQFKETVMALGPYLEIYVYPYGNAQTVEKQGHIEFICQHGPKECYGNKLHACAIDYLKNTTAAIFYNSCMMDSSQAGYGSDDQAADVCGRSMGVDSEPIKQCAKGNRGTQLLKYYGEESKKANFKFVPYILINGIQNHGENFKQDVCKAFKNPPAACNVIFC